MVENYICPRKPRKNWTVNGDYESFSSSVSKNLAPRVQIGVSYTFQTKNFKWRDKKQLNESDNELNSITTK